MSVSLPNPRLRRNRRRPLRGLAFALAALVLSLHIAQAHHGLWHAIHGYDGVCTVCLQLDATALPSPATPKGLEIPRAGPEPAFSNPLDPRQPTWRSLCRDPPVYSV